MDDSRLFGISVYQRPKENAVLSSLSKSPSYACFLNAHMIYEHHKNPAFEKVLADADFVFPDGMPIVYSLQALHGKAQERIAGNDFIFDLVAVAKERSLKMFWVGGNEQTLGRIETILSQQNVDFKTHSPPFAPIDDFDFDGQAELISSYQPDMILVGLGCPKQEIWMHRMKTKVAAPMYGLGGAFLLFAGEDTRAPKWMRNLSLEWVYRLALEPKRLFRRYLVTNTYFCFLFFRALLNKAVTSK